MKQSELAEQIARKAHAGQFRRDGKTPYIKHVESVVAKLAGQCDEIKAAGLLPTPVKSDAIRIRFKLESFLKIYERRKKEKRKGDGTLTTVLATFHQKRPSPESVEMMMFFPIGWTGLEPVETPKFQQWLSSHGRAWPNQF